MRTRYAYWVDNYADAGTSLTQVAKQFPESLAELEGETVQRIAFQMRDDRKLAGERLELLKALFDAGFTGDWDTQPSELWRELVLDALGRKDSKRAAEVLKRIRHPRALVNMAIDRRFDALVQAEPRSFDVVAAARAEVKRWQRVMEANPRKLEPVTRYMTASLTVGNHEEVISLADRVLGKQASATKEKPAFDDEEDELNWVYDIKSRALRRLGRWDDSLAVQAQARAMRETSSDKVSQAINLGAFYTALDRPDEALQALDGIDWANSLSGYGRMQYQAVRLTAYLAKGDRVEAEKVFAYLGQHQKDAPDTWQEAMLEWGDLDGAAALYIGRLRDPEKRTEALFAAQTFMKTPRTRHSAAEHARWEALLARPDVSAAIAEVGRRTEFPIYNPWD
jgi:tetratricopeptide (TPR) repeat protein